MSLNKCITYLSNHTLKLLTLKYSVPSAKFLAKFPTTLSRFLYLNNKIDMQVNQ